MEKKGEEPQTAHKDEETTTPPEGAAAAHTDPAQVESQCEETTPSPDSVGESQPPGDTSGGQVNHAAGSGGPSPQTAQTDQPSSEGGEQCEDTASGKEVAKTEAETKTEEATEGAVESAGNDSVDVAASGSDTEAGQPPDGDRLGQSDAGDTPHTQPDQPEKQAGEQSLAKAEESGLSASLETSGEQAEAADSEGGDRSDPVLQTEESVPQSPQDSPPQPDQSTTDTQDSSPSHPDQSTTDTQDSSPSHPDQSTTDTQDSSPSHPDQSTTDTQDSSPPHPDQSTTDTQDSSPSHPDQSTTDTQDSSPPHPDQSPADTQDSSPPHPDQSTTNTQDSSPPHPDQHTTSSQDSAEVDTEAEPSETPPDTATEDTAGSPEDPSPTPVSAAEEQAPEAASEPHQTESGESPTEEAPTETLAAEEVPLPPSQDSGAVTSPSEDTQLTSAPRSEPVDPTRAAAGPEDSSDGGEPDSADRRDSEDQVRDPGPPQPVEPATGSEEAECETPQDSAPAEVTLVAEGGEEKAAKDFEGGDHRCEDSQVPETEPVSADQEEVSDLQKASAVIVEESIASAVKVLAEESAGPAEAEAGESEGAEPSPEESSQPAESGPAEEDSKEIKDPAESPTVDTQKTSKTGVEDSADCVPTQQAEVKDSPSSSSPLASPRSAPKAEESEPPIAEDKADPQEASTTESEQPVDTSAALTSEADKASTSDSVRSGVQKTEPAAPDHLKEKQKAEDRPPQPLSALTKVRSDSGSSASAVSSDASLTRSGKRDRKRTSSDRKVTFKSPEGPTADTMGSGASRESDIEDADPRFAAQSTAAMSTASGWNAGSPPRSPGRGKAAQLSQQSSMKSSGHMSMARASRFNMDGYEDAEVRISSDGFSIQEVSIMEGQFVRFVCDQSCPNNATLLQVIYDGDELRPVINGYQLALDEHNGVFQQQLNLEGEYKFALSGIRCTPLMVRVKRKTELPAEVTDDGFMPDIIYVDQGTSVRWSWKQTAVPHTVTEVNYVVDKGCLSRLPPSQSMVATTTGTQRQTFNRPGIYYFKTEGAEPGKTHLCIVCVHAVSREYRVEILDRSFQPMILLIEEGDRVWFSWDRFKCKKAHSVYQIEPPTMDHDDDDAYEPVRDGFKWATPSKQGLMSHRFDKVGVFYFSDQNFEEAAEYIGTIIVKPKQREHVIKLQESGFSPDLLRVMTGDRVWWVWDGPSVADVGEGLLLLEEDKVLNPLSRKNNPAEPSENYQDLDAASGQLMTRVGAASVHFTTVGLYTYKVSDVGDTFNSCSVIVNPGSKNHTVHLTDNGFEPKVITVNCNDRVWWVWQSGKRQHNVVQVSHQGLPIPGGFCSGQARDSPSAFAHQFSTPGVYYFISKSLPQVFGAVVVSTRPQVHEVLVKESEIKPDPVAVQLNDVVAWVFGTPRQFDIMQVESVDQVLDAGTTHKAVVPRRCFARGISQTGTYHFKSKSFQKRKETNKEDGLKFMEETRLSSVVCDDRCDSIIVQLDKKGFHPNSVYLQKGHSLLWSWKGTDEEHNIIHVTDPDSAWDVSADETPLNMIKGPRAFNSGRPLPNDSFLYTFDEDGSYTVVSQGAPGFSCTVNVMEVARRTGEPYISSEQTSGTVDRYSKVSLASKTSGAKIYYTLDGSRPSINSKLYRPERGVTLRYSGLNFVRAVAVADKFLQSHIFTSSRFWILSKGDDDRKSDSSVSDHEMTVPPQTKTWDWWSCKPKIKGCFTAPGTLEVFWDPPEPAVKKQIKSYQIFLNGVSYCQKFPPSTNSLRLVGLAGGRKYNITVEVYPNHSKNQTIESNTLQLTCPKMAPPGGPVISLETTADPQTLSVVWMSIDSAQQPIDGYLVYLNDQQCGPKLVPESGSNRCKVVISGCDTAIDYKLYVLAVSADTDETRMSNVLVVQLPLDTSNITVPPPGDRVADEEVYLEYIEVLEGSGYLPQMDDIKSPRAARKAPPPSESETETETETESETGSTETGSETESESETDSERLPEARQLKQQGAVKLGPHVADGTQQTAPTKKVVEVETADLPEDCARLPLSKPSLRSFSDLNAYHYEQCSRSDLADTDGANTAPACRRLSFRQVARTVCQFLRGKRGQEAQKGQAAKEKVDWQAVRDLIVGGDRQPPRHVRPGAGRGEGKGLKSVLKTRPSQESMPASPAPVPRHGAHLRVEDAHQRRDERMVRSHSEETYDDSEPRHRPFRRLQRGHSDSLDDYDDFSVRRGDWRPPAGTPRYGSYRQDSYRDEMSDYSEGTGLRSASPDTFQQGRGRGRPQHFDPSPERHSHSSFSSQRRRVSFKDGGRERGYHRDSYEDRSTHSGYDFHGGGRRRNSMEMYEVYQRREYEEPSQRRMRRPTRQDSLQYNKQKIYREALDSDTASDKDSVEHLYISPRYAERLEDHHSTRKSVQFYLGPSENDAEHHPRREQAAFPPGPKSHHSARDDESLDTQVSDREAVVADDRYDAGQQYVVHEPYGDVPMYGHERDPTPPPLPEETGGMLSRFLNTVNHVPFIREDLLDSGVEDRSDRQPQSECGHSTEYQQSAGDRDHFHPQQQLLEYGDGDAQYQHSGREDRGGGAQREVGVEEPRSQQRRRQSKFYAEGQKKESTTPRIGGIVDDVTTSESETETESDYESDSERPQGGHVVILDASKNQATDTKENLKSRSVGEKGHYQDQDEGEGMAVVGHGGKSGRKLRGRATALIEVQKTVALDMDERQVKETGDIMEKTKLAVSTEQKSMVQVKEGELVTGDGDGLLPAPSIMATTKGKHAVRVAWELPREPDPQYRLQLFVVNVVGTKFSSEINSDISYECNLVEKGKQVRGVQHCWNIQDRQQCVIKGLQPGLTYRIYVICNYSTMRGNKPCEIQTTSSVLYYTTLGPPKAPRLRVVRVDLYQTCIAWEAPALHENSRLRGYQIQVDGKPLGGLRNPDIEQMVINNLVPGKTISINVVAVMARAAQESAPSKTIHITCPRRPAAPTISQQPSYKRGCVLLAWDKPRGHPDTTEETISAYAIYVDGQWHGEVKASRMGDQQGYQFFLTDLAPEQSYDVSVKAIAGDRTADPESQHVYCLSESFMSNIVPVMAPAAPKSPKLRLEGLHPDGIDVTWQTPQQSGDAHISGYQMLKNGKLYGSIIPSDVNSLRIRDVSLGEKLTLQLIALTEHPVGKGEVRGSSVAGDKDSGISGSTAQPEERSAAASPSGTKESQKVVTFTRHIHVSDWPITSEEDVFAGERYSGCKPGPKLVVHYTGLVCPPSEVWCERVTGHSALIVWNKAEERKAHYVSADSYQVTWWPGDRPQDEINSDSTTDDHLLITTLRPRTTYTVVVEARKMEKYTDMDEAVSAAETPEGLNAFILSSKSEHLTVKTASPPDPPRNVGVSATTCNSLNIAWDPPQEHGSEVIAIRIECISLNAQDPHHVTEDIMPDSTSADITGLHEKTDYLVRVVAVTEEYFDRLPDKHKHKRLHTIPRDVLVAQEESPWLPSASIVAKTAGTEAPANIRLSQSSMTSLVLTWTPPLVYGSNKLLSQIVRWRDVRRTKPTDPEDLIVASHVNLLPTEDTLTISDLVPGSQYQIVIEAVVSIKTSLNADHWDSGIERFRRTAHVMSKPLVLWTRAPIEPPKVLVQSYDQSSAVLYWEKPILMSIIGKDEEGNPRYLRRYLEGYRLEINGKLQSCLGPQAQTCTLTKCKPGKQYTVILVAMTCTEDRRRERKEKFRGYFKTTVPQDTDYVGLLDDELLDEAPSEPVEISLPKSQDGFLETVRSRFIHQEERDSRTFGDVEVSWTTQGQSNLLKQFSIVWFSSEDRVIQTKYVGPEKRRATIPVTHLKSIYSVTVEPCYYTDVLPQQPQDVQIMVPGPPDAPEIFLRSQDKEEFVIEWGEPRCFGGVKVKGYQVYMNEKKVGNELSNSHRKAVIPCRMNKMYRINLVALSSNPDYQDSPRSNTLVINSSKGPVGQDSLTMEEFSSDDHDLPVKVTGVTESGIHLDWSAYVENEGVAYYKIQWSSVAQPAQREVRLSPKDISCVINKCLPGTTHFVRLLAFNEDGKILEKSKQLTVQTSAPPDSPVLSVRACNFRYIAIQWEKPTTYGDALITGYKVYVNGIVEAVLSPDSLSFTFTQGRWCQEYSFQVQALTAGDSLNSKPSEPLVLTWPGTKASQIKRIPSVSSSSLRVTWTAPYLTDGVKVKHFKLCCVEEDTEKLVQTLGPIHPDTCEAEFKHLKKGGYMIYLETHLYGTGEIVRSDPIRMQPSVCPDPPQISVTVVGLEERRQLEKLTCDLANKRDRLIRAVGHKLKRIGALTHPLRAEKDEDVVMGAHTLTGVEELLENCFQALENYTGQLIAHVSWQCPQTNEDVHLSGFKVLVDGKQYGSSMHAGVRTVRLQLGLEEPSYRLSMVALSDKPQGSSVESSVVELLSAPFRPFSYYCYNNIHTQGNKWPAQGCCKYQDSLTYERQVGKKLANQGLLAKHVPPPACSLLDIVAGDYKPLMSGHRPQCATVLLFWTPWCLASSKVMDFYIRFAREASKEFNFVAVACRVSGVAADDRQTLVHRITSAGWREDGVMWHCTSECASNVYRTLSTINQTTSSLRVDQDLVSEKYMDLTELLGIAGVPTFLFIHPEGYIAWHGRYSSFDYPSFSAFMRHTNSEVMRHPCPVFNCDLCKNDMTIDQEAVAALLPEKLRLTPQAMVIKTNSPNSSETNLNSAAASRLDLKYAAINGFTENASGTDRVFMARKSSPKRRSKLSINRRPYSASATPQQLQGSPYLAKVVPSAPQARSRNRPVSAKAVHYM